MTASREYWTANDHYHDYYKNHKLDRSELWEFILPPVKTILEIGCSIGMNLSDFKDRGYSIKGIEINNAAAEYARAAGFAVDNYCVPPIFEDESSFDLVISMGVLMHNHDLASEIVNEMCRVSRKYVITGEVEEYPARIIENGLLVYDDYTKMIECSTGMKVAKFTNWIDKMPVNNEVIKVTLWEKT